MKNLDQIIQEQGNDGVIRYLMRSAIFKKAVDSSYELGAESKIYNEYLGRHGIHVRHSFRDYFMEMMTGADPTIKNLDVNIAERVLDENGNFVSDSIRSIIANNGRKSGMLGPVLRKS